MFQKQELKHFIIAAIITSIVFAFNDKQKVFQLSFYLSNLLIITIIVTISLLLHELAHKYLAKNYNLISQHKIMTIKRYGLIATKKLKKPIPIGIILPLLITFLSLGKIYFPLTQILTISRTKAIGKKFSHQLEYEKAKIASAGPLSHLLLLLILTPLNIPLLQQAILINKYLTLFNLLPIPNTDASFIFFGSRSLYLLLLTFTIISLILIKTLTITKTILTSLIIAIIITIIYYYFLEYKALKLS